MNPHMAAAAAAAASQSTGDMSHHGPIFSGMVPPPPHAMHPSVQQAQTNHNVAPPPPPPSSSPPQHNTQMPGKQLEVPYFNLPAGLIAPLVSPEDCDYQPLNPRCVKLPPPVPPSDRLIKAVELFYSPPSHERPRNADGWEKLGLYEFYKSKLTTTNGRAGCHANEKG